jgi:diacylglycerol kinase (ATP)
MALKSNMKSRNLTDSFNNAVNGIIYVIKNERNMKVHIVAAVAVLIFSLFFELTKLEFIIICITIGIVIICELFNTSIEVIVDTITETYDQRAKIIKDVAAGAVLVSAFVALVVAYFIFFDRVSSGLAMGITRVRRSPMHISIISLTLTIITVLVLKAFSKTGTPFRGGMPSGHAAVAFSATTAVALWSGSASITILSLIVSVLVVQSRLEAKVHSWFELLTGAVVGFFVTLLLFQVFYRG